ncbi:MAG TPA: hypothetical protein DC047_00285 [Blastocatellia bacterium]|nr:hypothetical protein [Blastocatellia bacterium]
MNLARELESSAFRKKVANYGRGNYGSQIGETLITNPVASTLSRSRLRRLPCGKAAPFRSSAH